LVQSDPAPAADTLPPSREGVRDLAVLLVAGLLAALLLYVLFHGKVTRFEDIGLGTETSSVFAKLDGDPIHCHDMTDVAACLSGFARRGAGAAALWLGNSQLHGVNQYALGQETASARLAARLRPAGVDLLTLSQPNANLVEHLVLYAYLRDRLPLRLILLPAVFDDVRDANVRATVGSALADAATRDFLSRSDAGRAVLATSQSTADPDLAALDQTVQERSEAFLNAWMDRHVELWDLRPEVRGTLGVWIRSLRNSVFGITPQSKRRRIEGSYATNLAAAEILLADARARDARVIFYVAPLRGDVDLPYVESEYARFKQDVSGLAERHGAVYLDLDQVVPADLFGMTAGRTLGAALEVDFMHFQAGGHAILADQLARALDGVGGGERS
jgi:hypothetical protein